MCSGEFDGDGAADSAACARDYGGWFLDGCSLSCKLIRDANTGGAAAGKPLWKLAGILESAEYLL
jgi:hypothetical protein